MALLFLIPILVCGYLYLTGSHIHKYKIKKLEGQQLYFKCAFYGFIFTIIGFSLTSFIISESFHIYDERFSLSYLQNFLVEKIFYSVNLQDINSPNMSAVLLESKRNIGFYSFFLISFLISLFITTLWNYIYRGCLVLKDCLFVLNKLTIIQYFRAFINSGIPLSKKLYRYLRHQLHIPIKSKKTKEKSTTWKDLKDILWKWQYGMNGIKKELKNPLDWLLYESIENHQKSNGELDNTQLIMLTMNDRKVYIGIVVGFGKDNDLFSIDNENFFFLPIKSGYRNKYDMRINITTNYSQAIEKAKNLSEIEIILNKKSIVSACKFDDKRFESFNNFPKFHMSKN